MQGTNHDTSILTPTLKVSIPVELATWALTATEVNGSWCVVKDEGYRTRPYLKPISLYLFLKAEAPESGWIQDYARQLPDLTAALGISQRTFYNYMDKLEDLKLAFREGKKIRLAGWREVEKQLHINTANKKIIEYELYQKKSTLYLWFSALEIEDNQRLQSETLWAKLNQNSTIKYELLTALCKRGYKYSDKDNMDKFISALFMLYITDFVKGTEVHDYLINLRSDINRSVKTIAEAWSSSKSLVSYYKRMMQAAGIISVSKVAVMSQYSRETKECHKNRYCHVIWDDKEKERVWFLCDQLTVIRRWEWLNFLNSENQKTAA